MSHQQDNIFAGTQVVSLVEVRGTNNSLVHPLGAVGVVTRTPTGDQDRFLVRFPDGFEASLTRKQLDVLKHFKDRIVSGTGFQPVESSAGVPPANFDLESFIIYRCVVGSRAYGLDSDDSDTDRRGIYLAPADLQWSLFGAPEQFEDNATQSCYWELQKFLRMALKANPNILEEGGRRLGEGAIPEFKGARRDQSSGRSLPEREGEGKRHATIVCLGAFPELSNCASPPSEPEVSGDAYEPA